MTQRENKIATALRNILNKDDVEKDSPITRTPSTKHNDKLDVLIQHVALLVKDLRHDLMATRRELFVARALLEEKD